MANNRNTSVAPVIVSPKSSICVPLLIINLRSLHTSIDAIASHIKSPPSLETLLEQINGDFALPLLAQCQKIAHLDGVITPAEAKVIDCINKKLNCDLALIK